MSINYKIGDAPSCDFACSPLCTSNQKALLTHSGKFAIWIGIQENFNHFNFCPIGTRIVQLSVLLNRECEHVINFAKILQIISS